MIDKVNNDTYYYYLTNLVKCFKILFVYLWFSNEPYCINELFIHSFIHLKLGNGTVHDDAESQP